MDEKANALKAYRKFGKTYYRAADVDALLSSLMEKERKRDAICAETEKLRCRMEDLQRTNDELQYENANGQAENERLHAQLATLENAGHVDRSALAQQIADLQDELTRSSSRIRRLSEELEHRQREIEEYDKLVSTDAISQANERAHQIVTQAMAKSDAILSDLGEQRTRVIAATRAAYYNALQFKASLVERFNTMERDLDDAIDVLRLLEAPQADPIETLGSPYADLVAIDGVDKSTDK